MHPKFQTKSGKRWYLVLKICFFALAALWLPVCIFLAYSANDWWALILFLLPLATFPLVIAWLALFFCIRHLICLKTNAPQKTASRKTVNMLYLLIFLTILAIVGCFVGSAVSLLPDTVINVYMLLTIPIVGMGAAIAIIEKRERKLNIDQPTE